MKTARRVTGTAHLLGAASFALLLIGCADSQTAPRPTLDLSRRPDFNATISTVVTYHDKAGKVRQEKYSQRVRASFKDGGGLARASVAVASAGQASAVFAAMGGATAAASASDGILTPVVAVVTGTLAYNYDETQTDSLGNQIRVIAWGPDAASPVTDVWAYMNDVLVGQYHSQWSAVSGGYVLATQTLGSYTADGSLAGTIVSTVTTGGGGGGGGGDPPLQTNNESFGTRLGSLPRIALAKVSCWLTPESAFAATASMSCWWPGLMFAGETYALGVATYSGLAFAFPGAYLTGWVLWTDSMYRVLECVDRYGRRSGRGGGKCSVNPKLCTGGGGSTF